MKNLFLMKRELNNAGINWRVMSDQQIEDAFNNLENKTGLPPVDAPVVKKAVKKEPEKPKISTQEKEQPVAEGATTPQMLKEWAHIAQNLTCNTKMTIVLHDGSKMILEVNPNA